MSTTSEAVALEPDNLFRARIVACLRNNDAPSWQVAAALIAGAEQLDKLGGFYGLYRHGSDAKPRALWVR